ncbi:hypothetical protein [Cohnella sp. REN36]|uniref:hypothetical protein n=1 Tax=Cohnella sp. REN36 TaxID=2887347 RepID=UPI001D142200|nr:hypothetical protein [Cohnella sp. REN36]MCC3372834.1 hypothetical protein [Cohnella sp. REN36]
MAEMLTLDSRAVARCPARRPASPGRNRFYLQSPMSFLRQTDKSSARVKAQ